MSSIVSTPNQVATGSRFLLPVAILLICGLLSWGGFSLYSNMMAGSASVVPTVKVAQGDVSLPIFAPGAVRGGNSQTLTAPMTGGIELHILNLKVNGSAVKAGDVVVQFDTTDQEFALKEAEADREESEQHIAQATTQYQADAEDARYELMKAKSDLALAELEARKNPILSGIVAKQNDLAVTVARDKLAQLEKDSTNKKATGEAGIQIQNAALAKAESKMKTAKENIEAMTLRAERDGYVSIKQAPPSGGIYFGGNLPNFQIGDSARPGVAVAEIPDLNHWEVAANVAELDRGHLTAGDKAMVTIIALTGRTFRGHVADIGTTSGGMWDRHFECKVALDEQTPELRPGMSAKVEITSQTVKNAIWVPAQAVFESDGKMFVYVKADRAFVRKDVTMVRRNETRVILTGLKPGQEVALANPTDATPKKSKSGGSAMQVISK